MVLVGLEVSVSFCVLIFPHPELTSLGFLENVSGSGRLRHLEDVTNIVRRDVSTACPSGAEMEASVQEVPEGCGGDGGRPDAAQL